MEIVLFTLYLHATTPGTPPLRIGPVEQLSWEACLQLTNEVFDRLKDTDLGRKWTGSCERKERGGG